MFVGNIVVAVRASVVICSSRLARLAPVISSTLLATAVAQLSMGIFPCGVKDVPVEYARDHGEMVVSARDLFDAAPA